MTSPRAKLAPRASRARRRRLGLAAILLVLARLPPPRAAVPAHDRRRRRHAVPLPDRGLAARPPAARRPPSRLVPRRVPRPPAAAVLLPAPVPADVGARPRWPGCRSRSSSAPSLGVFLLPLLAYAVLPADGLPLPGARCSAPRARSSSCSSRRTRSGAAPSPARSPASSPTPTAPASRSCSSASPTARTRAGASPWLPAALLARDRARPRVRGALGRAVRVLLPVRRAPSRAHARLAGRRRPASPSRWPPSGCCRCSRDWGWTTPYDDPWITVALAQPLPAAAVVRCSSSPRSPGSAGRCSCAAALGGPDHRLLFLLHCRARRRRAGRRRARARDHRRALRALRAARRCAWPARRRSGLVVGAPGRRRTSPRWRSSCSRSCTATSTRGCCGPGSTGTTPASRPRSTGRPSGA